MPEPALFNVLDAFRLENDSQVAAYIVAVEIASSVVVEKGVQSSHKHDTKSIYFETSSSDINSSCPR